MSESEISVKINPKNNAMSILFLPKLLPRADVIGGPILIYHRIRNLYLMGHKITLIAPAYTEADWADKSLEPFCEEIIRVDSVMARERDRDEVKTVQRRLNRPMVFLSGDGSYDEGIEDALKSALKKEHFDAVIAEYSMMGQYIEANRSFIPADTMTVISVHECYTRAFEQRAAKGENISEDTVKELFDYEFKMYDAADRILTLTKEDSNILIDYAPGLKNKIRVVPHGVDTAFYTRSEKKSVDSSNILYLGNFQHYPNVDAVKNFINHCWNKIQKEVPEAKFYVIGFNPPQELLDLRSENVIVDEGGSDEDVRRVYWNSDVFVVPVELGTGCRGKLLEAMACGLPAVATRLATFGINPTHGEDMFVTDDYDVFSEYVIMLLKDIELRKKIGNNAFLLSKKFDHKRAAEKLEQVLTEKRQSKS